MKLDTFGLLRDAAHIKRFHTVRTVVNPETVGHHTFGVMTILFFMYDEPPMALLKYALFHDAAEMATGDVPATAKWNFPKLAEALKDAEGTVEAHYEFPGLAKIYQDEFKFADMMDLCFKCMEEISVGNVNFIPILERGINFCAELYKNSKEVKKLPAAGQLIAMLVGSPFFPFEEFQDGKATKH